MMLFEKEEELFARWREGLPSFVTDGAVDSDAYAKSSLKILLLLKEVNDKDGGGWCLRDFLRRSGGRYQTWDNVTRWVSAIRSLPGELTWDELQVITEEKRCEVLRSIAAVNLKKVPGGTTTDINAFWKFVQQYAEFAREQFELYQADIVICCGSLVTDAFKALIKIDSYGTWRSTSRGVEYLEYLPNKFVIAFSHPEARVADNLLHYGLLDTVRELFKTRAIERQ